GVVAADRAAGIVAGVRLGAGWIGERRDRLVDERLQAEGLDTETTGRRYGLVGNGGRIGKRNCAAAQVQDVDVDGVRSLFRIGVAARDSEDPAAYGRKVCRRGVAVAPIDCTGEIRGGRVGVEVGKGAHRDVDERRAF